MAVGPGLGGSSALGRYELILELTKSQLGSLWAARPTPGGAGPTLVAVRRIRTGPPLSADDVDRLSEAAWASLAVHGDSVVPVLDVVVTENELGIVSEYTESEPLRSILRLPSFRRKPLSHRAALRVALDLLDALASLQQDLHTGSRGATHASGGLSPDSVLLGSDGHARITDLAVASILGSIPKFASHPDLAAYAAPEQLAFASELDSRTDVFALGVMLWELMTGRRLFVGATHAAVSEKIGAGDIPRLDATKPLGGEAVPASVADLVARALQRDPSDRFANTEEMTEAITLLGPSALATREELGLVVEELTGTALAIRNAAVTRALEISGRKEPGDARPGSLLSSAPPKARRGIHKQTLLGVAPPGPSEKGEGPVSHPPSIPPPPVVRPPSTVPLSPSTVPLPPSTVALPPPPPPPPPSRRPPTAKVPARSQTLLGVAPPQPVLPIGEPMSHDLEELDLDSMRPSRPGFLPTTGPVPSRPNKFEDTSLFNELMSRPADRQGKQTPPLEAASAFDFMADRDDDNLATLTKTRDFAAADVRGGETLLHGSPGDPPSGPARSSATMNTAVYAETVPGSDAPLLSADDESGEPLVSAAAAARTLRTRRIVAGVVAVTLALLLVALVVSAFRRSDERTANAKSKTTTSAVTPGKVEQKTARPADKAPAKAKNKTASASPNSVAAKTTAESDEDKSQPVLADKATSESLALAKTAPKAAKAKAASAKKPAPKPAPKKAATAAKKPASKKPAQKAVAKKPASKPAAKKAAAKKPVAKAPVKKAPAKPTAKKSK